MDSAAPSAVATPDPITAPREPQTAAHAAVAAGDPTAFREAKRAERSGKPLAAPTAAAEPAKAAPAEATADTTERQVSKRQQQINDYERRIAEQNERIARLEAGHAPAAPRTDAPRTEPAKADAPAAPKTFTDAIKTPDISTAMLSETEFFAKFPEAPYAAYGRYWGAYDAASERAAASEQTQSREKLEAQIARIDRFLTKLDAAKAADPEFMTKLSPEVRALKPVSSLADGEKSGPLNILWDQVYDSDVMDKLLVHFTVHPEDLRRLETPPPHIAAIKNAEMRISAHIPWILREFGKLEARFDATAAPAPKPQPKTISTAPTAAEVVGTRAAEAADPKASAIRRGDTRAYREQRRLERASGTR